MEPGCWSEVIKAADSGTISRPSVVWGHDWSLTTGKVLSAEEFPPGHPALPDTIRKANAGALRIVAAYNLETQRGREAFSDVKNDVITQWSVGFIPARDGVKYDSKGVRHIHKVAEWPEVSNVLVGASPGTFTAAIKSTVGAAEDRQQRTADRLARALAIHGELKSKLDTQDQREGAKYSLRDSDGQVKFPINDCADVEDAWGLRGSSSIPKDKVEAYVRRTAKKLGCDGPWSDDGKAVDPPLDTKDGRIPDLQGDEAQHMKPLQAALAAIENLIAQEVAEDEPEFDCVIRLALIGQDLLNWAQSEAAEYGELAGYAGPMVGLMAAGADALHRKEEAARLLLSTETLQGLALLTTPETAEPSPQPHVPDSSDGDDGLTHFARRMARPQLDRLLNRRS